MATFELKALITAVDRLSPHLKSIRKNLGGLQRQFKAAGKDAGQWAAGLTAAMAVPAKLFADAEMAGKDLQNALMNKDGVAGGFNELMGIATQLGNVLPGNTADFARMATVMRSNSVATNDMIDGGLQAAAYLGVLVKDTDGAAQGLAKLSNVFGIAGKDLVSFADTAQRVTSLGVPLEDFVQAMSKAGGPLKAVGAQGVGVANSMAPLVAMLTQAGIQADEAGTGIKTMISEFAKQGKFTTIEAMVEDLESLHKLNPAKLMLQFEKAFGKEHAAKALIVAAGGYGQLNAKMREMASLDQKIQNQLGALTSLWDAMVGTIQNAGVALGSVYSPELKAAARAMNGLAESAGRWIGDNKETVKLALEIAAGFVGMKVAFAAAGVALGVLTAAMNANPWMALLQGLLIVAPLIYANFDKIVLYVSDKIEALAKTLESVKTFFSWRPFDGNGSSMRPPGYQKPRIVQPPPWVSGSVDVNFNNTPAGTRVAASNKGSVAVNPNVGYRSFALGMP